MAQTLKDKRIKMADDITSEIMDTVEIELSSSYRDMPKEEMDELWGNIWQSVVYGLEAAEKNYKR